MKAIVPNSANIVVAILILPIVVATAQVTIPAKSASSLDPASDAADSTESNDSVLQKPKALAVSPKEKQPTASVERAEGTTTVPNPRKMERLAELRRELRIDEAALKARIALPSDELFESQSPAEIDKLAEPTLAMLVEYLELTDKKRITVKPFYVASEEGARQLAWTRSLALIEWLAAKGEFGLERFHATGPMPVEKPTPKPFSRNPGETEFLGRLELHLE